MEWTLNLSEKLTQKLSEGILNAPALSFKTFMSSDPNYSLQIGIFYSAEVTST